MGVCILNTIFYMSVGDILLSSPSILFGCEKGGGEVFNFQFSLFIRSLITLLSYSLPPESIKVPSSGSKRSVRFEPLDLVRSLLLFFLRGRFEDLKFYKILKKLCRKREERGMVRGRRRRRIRRRRKKGGLSWR